MSKMKLSELFKERKVSFYQDENGRVKTRVIEPVPEGEIVFKYLDFKTLEELNKKNDKDNLKNDNEYIYDILDTIVEVDKDVSKEKFIEAMILPPNSIFELFKEQIFDYLVDIMKKFNKTAESYKKYSNELTNEAKIMNERMDKQKKLLPPEPVKKSDEEILKELSKQIKVEKNQDKKDKLILEAWKLGEKINKKIELENKKKETEDKIAETENKLKEVKKIQEQNKDNNVVDISNKVNESEDK